MYRAATLLRPICSKPIIPIANEARQASNRVGNQTTTLNINLTYTCNLDNFKELVKSAQQAGTRHKIRSLHFEPGSIYEKDIRALVDLIAQFPQIKELSLGNLLGRTGLDNPEMGYAAEVFVRVAPRLSGLWKLDLGSTGGISNMQKPGLTKALEYHPALTHLSLANSMFCTRYENLDSIALETLFELAPKLHQIKALNLSRSFTRLDDDTIPHLLRILKITGPLQSLDISGNNLFYRAPQNHSFYYASDHSEPLYMPLIQQLLTSVEHLDISSTLSGNAVDMWKEALLATPRIRTKALVVSNNELSQQDFVELTEAMRKSGGLCIKTDTADRQGRPL